MKNKANIYLLSAAVGVLLAGGNAEASDTTTYTYDALGRLVAVSTSGGVNKGLSVATCYDRAGNRANYTVSGASGTPPAAPPPCSPSSQPPSGNQPPLAVDDTGGMNRCTPDYFAVLSNDYDPDGNVPLALVSVSGSTRGTPEISGTYIYFTPSGLNGVATVTYVMRDSLGATASATLSISISNGSCGSAQ